MTQVAERDNAEATIIHALRARNQLDAAGMEAYREAKSLNDDIPERVLIRIGLATDREIASAYSEHLALPLLDPALDIQALDRELVRLLPEKLCRDQIVIPVAILGDVIDLAFATPSALLIIDEVQLLTGLGIRPVVAPCRSSRP